MRVLLLISALMTALCCLTAQAATPNGAKGAVMLEILDGDTSFLVDERKDMAWWIVGECRRAIPLVPDSPTNNLLSRPQSDSVSLGSRQIELRQQFRFDMASTPPTVSVYSSVRSGWSPVPVKRIDACSALPDCRARMELPAC